MKNLAKRFSSLLVVMALLLSMIVPVHAAPAQMNGEVIIENTNTAISIVGNTYSVYRIFNLTYNDTHNSYSYTLNPAFVGLPAWLNSKGYTYTGSASDPRGMNLLAHLSTYDFGSFNGDIPGYPYVGDNDHVDLHAFSAQVNAFLAANSSITPVASTSATSEVVTFTGLQLGYFIVTGSANPTKLDAQGNPIRDTTQEIQAVCSLVSSDPKAVVHPKADAPTIDKKVYDVADEDLGENPTDDGWKKSTDAEIGDKVNFRLVSTIPNMNGYTSYTYTITDILSQGLTFDATPSKLTVRVVKAAADLDNIQATDVIATMAVGTDYTVGSAPATPATDGTVITINFLNFLQWYNIDKTLNRAGDKIVVEYETELNNKAVMANEAPGYNPNKTYLEYSNNPYGTGKGKTPEVEVKVYTFEAKIIKFAWVDKDGNPNTSAPGNNDGKEEKVYLADAKFALYRTKAEADAAVAAVIAGIASGTAPVLPTAGRINVVEETPAAIKTYRVAQAGETAVDIVTPADGLVKVQGLDEGMYYFVEIDAPDGFNILEEPVPVGIDAFYSADGTLAHIKTWVYNDSSKGWEWSANIDATPTNLGCLYPEVPIENKSGKKLPETGGIGRTIFTVAGSGMMLAAAVIMIAKRKTRFQ